MNLYNIRILKSGNLSLPLQTQVIDIDCIVSISPIATNIFYGYSMGESFAFFTIFLKLGAPITIEYGSGSAIIKDACDFPTYILEQLKIERDNLIKAWENKSSTWIPAWKTVEIDCGAHIIPTDDFNRGST